jgi:hypothetical protein
VAEMLDYSGPSAKPPPRLLPAMLIALVGGPLGCAGAAIMGLSGVVGWPLSWTNLLESAAAGGVVGLVGGGFVAIIARAFRSSALPISIVGVLVLSLACALLRLSIPTA